MINHCEPTRTGPQFKSGSSRGEETILWQSLERIPEHYREPLVLFYREHQSVERVAAALDLKENAVKQRLSRGRKRNQKRNQTVAKGACNIHTVAF